MTASPLSRRRAAVFGATGLSLIVAGVLAAGTPASLANVANGTSRAAARPAVSGRPAAAPPALGQIGSYAVDATHMSLVEPAHTGPTGTRLPARTLVLSVRYPRRAAGVSIRFPLIMFAPGYLQCDGPYGQLLRAVASAGYVVASVDFPRNDCAAVSHPYEPDLVNEPGDLSYAITRLLRMSASASGPMAALISPALIGAAGHSDGGDVVALLAANACCTDHRVRAAAVLSGAEWIPRPGRYFPAVPVPILFTQGNRDTINPPFYSQQLYNLDRSLNRYYLDLLGANHTVPYWGGNPVEQRTALVIVLFFDRWLLNQSTATAMNQAGNAAGKAILVSGKKAAPTA